MRICGFGDRIKPSDAIPSFVESMGESGKKVSLLSYGYNFRKCLCFQESSKTPFIYDVGGELGNYENWEISGMKIKFALGGMMVLFSMFTVFGKLAEQAE